MRGLQGRNAIVTGGASGIGRAICQRLGEEGCSVGVFDIDADGAGTTADAITNAGGNARAYQADIASLDAVKVRSVRPSNKTSARPTSWSTTPDGTSSSPSSRPTQISGKR